MNKEKKTKSVYMRYTTYTIREPDGISRQLLFFLVYLPIFTDWIFATSIPMPLNSDFFPRKVQVIGNFFNVDKRGKEQYRSLSMIAKDHLLW